MRTLGIITASLTLTAATFGVATTTAAADSPTAQVNKAPVNNAQVNESQGNSGQGFRAAAVIAHRGASGYRPEHTIGAYELAIAQCADFIEPDLVMTKDGVLVDRHENDITGTTDVATRPEFATRMTTKVIDGTRITGWFTEDFTLAELKTLRAVERLPALRTQSVTYNGRWDVPTFEEGLKLATSSTTCAGNPVGIIPEIKHPTYFASIGLAMERKVAQLLAAYGFDSPRDPAVIQSFEVSNLRELDGLTDVRLAQLVNCSGAPWDQKAAGTGVTYQTMVTRAGLREVRSYADQVGLCKDVMIPRNADGTLGKPTSVIKDAHRNHLTVVGWTFRAENQFLPVDYRSSANPAEFGDMIREIHTYLAAGMDQFFTDQPDLGVAAMASR